MDLEQALLTARDRIAAIRLLADLVADSRESADDPMAFSGLADVCADLVALLTGVKAELPIESLAIELSHKRRRR